MDYAFLSVLLYTISTLLVISISIISTPFYTRMMSTADYGISATFNTWYSLLSIICSLNVSYSIGRAKIDFGPKFEKFISALQIICSVATGVIFSVIFILYDSCKDIIGLNKKAVFVLFVYLLFGTVVTLYQCLYRFRYQYKQNIYISIFITVSTVVVSLVLISCFSEKYMGKILGTTVPVVILGLYFWTKIFCCKTVPNRDEFKTFSKYALAYSAPLIVHSLSIYVLGQSDRLMVKYYCGDSVAGIYSLAYQYALLISLVINAVNSAWNPWFHDNYALKNFSSIREKIVPFLILGCFLGVGCVAVAPEAINILGGKEYIEGVHAVFPICMGVITEFVYSQYVIIEMHLKKTRYTSLGTFIASLLNLLLNWIFIPKYGFVAAAYTTFISYMVLLFMHYYIIRVVLKVHLYQDRIIYSILIGLIGISWCFTKFYSFILFRYLAVIVLIVLFILYNKKFILEKLLTFRER